MHKATTWAVSCPEYAKSIPIVAKDLTCYYGGFYTCTSICVKLQLWPSRGASDEITGN